MSTGRGPQRLQVGVEVFGVRDGFVADESLSGDGSWVSIALELGVGREGTYWSGSRPGILMSSLRKLVGPLWVKSVRCSDDVSAGVTDDLQCWASFFLIFSITAGEDMTKPVAYSLSEAGLRVHDGVDEPLSLRRCGEVRRLSRAK